jgi:glycosyltransferase involved in cell wall biosynthesis
VSEKYRQQLEIALPTYNCAPWIDAFFESVGAQDFADWRIIARDDASTDGTATCLARWLSQLEHRMEVVAGSGQLNLGMVGNYDAVLSATTAPWVMFADPDDVWRPGKISLALRVMRETEEVVGTNTPVVVCTDAEVVDSQLRPLAPSYWRWSRMNPTLAGVFRRLVVENPVLTSTMMVNRALLDLALPFSGAAACPDWWPALVACAFGRIVCLSERTVLYRRHPSNDSLDPFASTLAGALRRFRSDPSEPRHRLERLLYQLAPQAAAFAARYRDRLLTEDVDALEAAADLPTLGALARRWTVAQHGLWFGSTLKNVALLLFL